MTACARCHAPLDGHPRSCPACGNDPLMDATKILGGTALVVFAAGLVFPPLLLLGFVVIFAISMAWLLSMAGWSGYSPAKQDLPWGRS